MIPESAVGLPTDCTKGPSILDLVIPILMHFWACIYFKFFVLSQIMKLEYCKPHKVTCLPTKFVVINDVKLFLTVHPRYTAHKFLM